ncbi:MAG: hypothetical protein KA141_10710 [Rubrivivax sp.]|jgi:hypothetical protein|nr:hypothetical protein [Rubrivivax sp.]
MSTEPLPLWLYRSEAFAEDLEPATPLLPVQGPHRAGRRPNRSTALLMLPAMVALASTVAAVVARPA